MAEAKTHNIVILGGSYGALGTAHGILKKLDTLESQTKKKYKITMIANSSKFWYSVGAPRAMLKPYPTSNDDSFIPVTEGFKTYPAERFEFIHAEITTIDTQKREVAYKLKDDSENLADQSSNIHFDTIIIALGSVGQDPLYSLHGSHVPTYKAYEDVQRRVGGAKTVMVVGGGSAGVETAGELGDLYGRKSDSPKDITILSGSSRLLAGLKNESIGARAEQMLADMGVKTAHNLKLSDTKDLADGAKEVTLSDGSTRQVDLLFVATGRRPNSSIIPPELLTEKGQIKVDQYTRIPGIESAYATGDIASLSNLTLIAMLTLVPATYTNVIADLSGKGKPKEFKMMTEKDMQLVPIGPGGGVGAMFGWSAPSFAIRMLKAKDFMFPKAKDHLYGRAL